ncbi:hypothetical protein PMAYCL1PPCAC_33229 [Pristionchus mayeri]|uniref:UDP-glucuronosyltransferase n=1 Tax=Pristionchus mayeri TaxID=1317129 RepID=A0AAN5DGY4_9BILA|nr:hypothetical protein PMAYCL1PPCAC_33229 [Pristionchus mayeri]
MQFRPLLLLFAFFSSLQAYKFLAYSPQFAASHVNFIAKVSDTLVDAGHEVVILSTKVDDDIKSAGTKKARVIEIPQSATAKRLSDVNDRVIKNVWNSPSVFTIILELLPLVNDWITICNETLHYPGLIDQLKDEKFDGAFSESLDILPFGIFHLAGIDKFAVTQSFSLIDGRFDLTQTPSAPSYVPSNLSSASDKMTFFERLFNFIGFFVMSHFADSATPKFQKIFEEFQPGFPPVHSIVNNNSLIFLNSDPFLDFPRPTTHRVIEIGGIVTSTEEPPPLDEKWSSILSLRPHTILLSFGSFVKAYAMPEEYKRTIRDTLALFPNVTFIWKYEKPEDNVSAGVTNIVESTWVPQVSLLNDARLSAFITHGGVGSTTEAAMAGVPLVVIPVMTDQLRNAQVVKRNGFGVVLEKEDLGRKERLSEAIKEVIENKEYREKTRVVSSMLREVPFSAKEKLVRNMEFMVAHGPLRMLDHYGTQLNFFQYYLIDVFAFLLLISLVVLSILFVCIYYSLRCCYRKISGKVKKD